MIEEDDGAVERGITLWALFRCFLVIGVTGFGGVLPVVIHELVERRRWLTAVEFTEILSVCQILPGPNIVNISVVFGMRVAGWVGSAVAMTGLLLLPIVIGLTLAGLYSGFADVPQVQGAMRAVAAAASGLVVAVAAKLFWPQRRNPIVHIIGGLVILAVIWLRLPLPIILGVLAPCSIAITAWRLHHD